ncbi:MAG: hemolysin family protein [Pontiellaceae bacterium]|jgi:putative hemolysin|nr:hemolysin family protein [Pontiellaceae bacterium]
MNEIDFHYLAGSMAALLLAGFWSVLYSAFRKTGNAGILRLAEKKPQAKARLEQWAGRWNLLRTTLRVGLTFFEITAVYFAFHAVEFPMFVEWIGLVLIMTPLYLILIRVIPFVLAESYADRLSLFFLPLVIGFTRLLTPFVWPIYAMERGLLARVISSADDDDGPTPEEEIMTLVEQADDEELEEEEREIIRSVFEFGDTVVREIMTPRVDIVGLRADSTVAECVGKIQHATHSRFPVYDETIDNLVGVVHVKDMLRLFSNGEENRPVKEIVKKLSAVPETMPISDLLRQMRSQHFHMALVVDEYGGTAGLVCMEDIIEELVGEIRDEYDQVEKDIQIRSDGTFLVKAGLAVADLNGELGLRIPESDEYDSLGGYVLNELGTIPPVGTKVAAPGLEITVQNATPRRIHTLLIAPLT